MVFKDILKNFKKKADPFIFGSFLLFSILTIIFYAIWRFHDPSWLNGFDTIGGPIVLAILLVYGIMAVFAEETNSVDREDVVSNAICGSIYAIVFTSFIYTLGGLCLAIILQMRGDNILSMLNELLFSGKLWLYLLIMGGLTLVYF